MPARFGTSAISRCARSPAIVVERIETNEILRIGGCNNDSLVAEVTADLLLRAHGSQKKRAFASP